MEVYHLIFLIFSNCTFINTRKTICSIAYNFTFVFHYFNFKIQLNGAVVEKEIRSIEVSDRVSEVSKHEYIRNKLVLIQQKFGEEQSVVMDGRDIGTVVFPNADIKFWIKASAQKRAERRWEEYKSKGEDVKFQQVLENIISRDEQDSNRKVSPLKKPKGSIEIDTSDMDIEQTCNLALSYVKKFLP